MSDLSYTVDTTQPESSWTTGSPPMPTLRRYEIPVTLAASERAKSSRAPSPQLLDWVYSFALPITAVGYLAFCYLACTRIIPLNAEATAQSLCKLPISRIRVI